MRNLRFFIPDQAGGKSGHNLDACRNILDAPRFVKPSCNLNFWCLQWLINKEIGAHLNIFWNLCSKIELKNSHSKNFPFVILWKFQIIFLMPDLYSKLFQLSQFEKFLGLVLLHNMSHRGHYNANIYSQPTASLQPNRCIWDWITAIDSAQ